MTTRLAMTILLLGASLCAGGCAMQPWVRPLERDRLADPIMSVSRDPLYDRIRQHTFGATEAARGATADRGGGCGCN